MNKLTYEQEKKLREMKEFRISIGICAVFCWLMTLGLILIGGLHLDEQLLIPFGGIVTTTIFLLLSRMIRKIEDYKQIN